MSTTKSALFGGLCAIAIATLIVVIPSCDDGPTPQPCTNIPPGGCPKSHGVACADPNCEAVYLCRENNVWELEQQCPARPDSGLLQQDAGVDGGDASTPFDASIDAPPGAYGGPGCESLQPPDCALGVALSCGGCCGCEDLFVCQNGGWDLWGTCADGGVSPGK